MLLELNRKWLTEKATVGELTVGRVFLAFTLEDTYRPLPAPKVPGQTAIPCGVYDVVVNHSERFGVDMPMVLNVPGFVGVRIHWGNGPGDTEGCILVGLDRGPEQVLRSRMAYERVFGLIRACRARGETVKLIITVDQQEPTK